jgi:ribokinase
VKPIVVVGSLNADLVVRVARFPSAGETTTGQELVVHPGGKGANQAYAAGRLGARVNMVGRVGGDDAGRLLLSSLAGAGVDVDAVGRDSGERTGTALITIDASGQNQIVIVPGANGLLSPADVESRRDLIASAGFLLLQLEVPLVTVEAAARVGRDAGAVVILDPAPARVDCLKILPLVDYVTPNETELAALVGEPGRRLGAGEARALARALLEWGPRKVVAKLGAEGACRISAEGERAWPALPVSAVDTTAAGDVWNGAFATALADGADESEAGEFANAAAAISVTRAGAQPSMPTRAEVEERRRPPGSTSP